MIHWSICLLLIAAVGLIVYAVGRPLWEARGIEYGVKLGWSKGYRAGRDKRFAAEIRIWGDKEEEGGVSL